MVNACSNAALSTNTAIWLSKPFKASFSSKPEVTKVSMKPEKTFTINSDCSSKDRLALICFFIHHTNLYGNIKQTLCQKK